MNWIIAFATEKFYVTEEDARFYMKQVATGKKFVALKNGMMLSDRALYVIPAKTIEESKLLESGRWQCVSGKWHSKWATCMCDKVIEIENGIATLKPVGAVQDTKKNALNSLT